ncbi:MAG: CocE/NonD family hydrolase, partial [Solirubrobacterales bacterium]|nr:CocE/NonD family hydrolase [Solirubrobacterales bacterium]
MRLRPLLTLAALAALSLAPAANAAEVPANATWTEATITEADGTQLHADVLRPKGLPADAKTPVILSIGPYFNHAGQTGALGGVEGTSYDPVGPPGPSDRFYDFLEGTKLLDRGYTFVMVDLRGFGGSTGCLDWAGPGEQADVKAAVEWAAGQPWSTGRVGMYGKSYDGVTGLIGAVSKPKGLAAVISQEPVYDLYRYLWDDGIRFVNSLGTPALYDLIAGTPGPLAGDPSYTTGSVNDLQRPGCPVLNYLDQQDADHGSDFWKARNLIPRAKDTDVPVLLTQGFLENNTKPDGAFEFYNGLQGPKRAWFGMWDHVRGNDRDADGRLLMGREGWFDEAMRWYDHYVKGVPLVDAPVDRDPPVVVQTSDGTWRGEDAWPPADATASSSPLLAGEYADDGQNNGSLDGGTEPTGQGAWTFSPPLAHRAHLAGVPRATVASDAAPGTNLVVDLYDVAPDGKATLVSRGGQLVAGTGPQEVELYGNDWRFEPGHRVGVLVTGANAEWWLHQPTNATVSVTGASVRLPWLRYTRADDQPGGKAVRLEQYLEDAPFQVDPQTIADRTQPAFALPPALAARPASTRAAGSSPARRGGARMQARLALRR